MCGDIARAEYAGGDGGRTEHVIGRAERGVRATGKWGAGSIKKSMFPGRRRGTPRVASGNTRAVCDAEIKKKYSCRTIRGHGYVRRLLLLLLLLSARNPYFIRMRRPRAARRRSRLPRYVTHTPKNDRRDR